MHTLSSLNCLNPDGTAKTKSNKVQQRPKSRDASQAGGKEVSDVSKDEDAALPTSSFKDFPDYASQNSKLHNSSRSDTFRTATSPTRKKPVSTAKMAGEDLTSLSGAYLISGLRHDVREIGKEIKAEVQEEVSETVSTLKKELQATLDIIGNVRDSTVGVIMTKLKDDIHKILSDAGWPLKVDFTPIQEEFRSGEQTRQKGYASMMQQLEDRLGQKLGLIAHEIPLLRNLHEQARVDLEETRKCMLEEMLGLRQTVAADIAQELRIVQKTQQDYFAVNAGWEARVEAQLEHHVHQQTVNVDFGEVLDSIKENTRDGSFDFSEMHKALDSLNKEVVDMRAEVALAGSPTKQVVDVILKVETDEIWTQTDTVQTLPGWAQTDDKFWKAKASKSKGASGTNTKSTNLQAGKPLVISERATTLSIDFLKDSAKDKGLFIDADAMKKKARAALIKVQYNVFDSYYHTGYGQMIAKSVLFENITFLAVALNVVWIAIDADYNHADMLIDADLIFQVIENSFCIFFTWELAIRFSAFKKKRDCFKDGWFNFDLLLVALMVLETWVMSIVFLILGTGQTGSFNASVLRVVRIVKILRLSRLARLMRAVPEIIIFLKGIGAAFRSVSAIMALWCIIVYIFAVFFVQTADGDVKENQFYDVPTAMNTLLLEGILPDNAGVVRVLSNSNPIFWPIIMAFVLLASVTLSYMLIGVLVQIVQVIAVTEKEKIIVGTVASHLRHHWQEHGHEMDHHLSMSDFQALLVEPEVAIFLDHVGVDMLVLVDMASMMYEDIAKEHNGVSFAHLVEAVLNMRGTNPVTVQDVKSQLRIMKKVVQDSVANLSNDTERLLRLQGRHVRNIRKLVLGEPESDVEGLDDNITGPELSTSG